MYIAYVHTVYYHLIMLITWDDNKNAANFKKHGIWFEEATTILFDPMVLSNINMHLTDDRFEYLGHSDRSRLLYVVTVEKDVDEIRIVSARKATNGERKTYEEGI